MDPNPIDLRLLARQHERLRRMVRALVGDEHRAEDVVQDAWVRALESGPNEPRVLGGWLKTVTRRLVSNDRRGRRRRGDREREAARPESLPSSDEIAERVEIESRVLSALDGLDEPHRTTLRDRYLGELTPTELARRDGVSLNTVKSRLSRARAAMRERLDRDGLGGDVHWSIIAAPLLIPRGPWATPDVPGGATPTSTGATSGTGVGTSSLTGAAVLGGTLVMKKALLLAAVLLIGAVAWQLSSREPDALRVTPSTEARTEDRTDPVLAGLDGEDVVTHGARVAIEDAAGPSASTPAGASATWRIAGRARDPREDQGARGIPFDLAVYAGYAAEGEPLRAERVVSGDDGRFVLTLEDPGRTVTVTVESEDTDERVVVTYGPYVVVAGDSPPELDVLVFLIDGRLEGTVRDGAGNLIEGCAIKGLYGVARTDSSGRYGMRIATRAWGEITASAPGFGRDSRQLDGLDAGAVATLDFTLGEAVRIEGVVRASGGTAIAGARVKCSGPSQVGAVTDAAGRYVMDSVAYVPGESVWMSVRAEGFGPESLDLELEVDRREYEQDFELIGGVPVAGRLTAPGGTPVAGAEIWIGRHANAWGTSTTLSDDDGRFLFDCVPPGRMQAGAKKDGYAPVTGAFTIAENGGSEEIVLQFPVSRTLRGIVQDSTGKPVSGVAVAVRQSFDYVGSRGRSNEHGEFEITALPEGSLTLEAFAIGYVRASVLVGADESEALVAIEIVRAGRIAGRAVDAATGAPLEDFIVRFVRPTDPDARPAVDGYNAKWSRPGVTFHDEEGRWSTGKYDELQPGAWIGVEIRADGYAPAVRTVQVIANDVEPQLVHELVRPVTVELVASVRGSGEPVAGATIQAATRAHLSEEDLRWTAITDEAGSAVLDGVSPGSLFVTVTRAVGASLRLGPFEVASTPSRSVLAIEVPAGQTVEVTLLDVAGDPLPDRAIALSGTVEGSGHVTLDGRTDEDGVCRIEGVPAGQWQASRILQDGVHKCHDLIGHVTVTEGGEVVRLELRPPGDTIVRGTVEAEQPIPPGCKVTALSRDDSLNHGAFIREGRFELQGLAPGRYMVTLSYWELLSSTMMMGHAELEVLEGDLELELVVKVEPR